MTSLENLLAEVRELRGLTGWNAYQENRARTLLPKLAEIVEVLSKATDCLTPYLPPPYSPIDESIRRRNGFEAKQRAEEIASHD